MDFIGGALPNVMFLIGVIAIGIGLGLEFKIIEVKNGLSRGGRIGACVVGLALVATSIILYLRPTPTVASSPAAVATATTGSAGAPPTQAVSLSSSDQGAQSQGATAAPTEVPTAAPTEVPTAAPTEVPTAAPTEVPTVAPTEVPTVAPTNTATAAPTKAPTATRTATPKPTAVSTVKVPDIRGMSPKDAEKLLAQSGLQLGELQPSCEELGVDDDLVIETRKGRIACQSLTPDSDAPLLSVISYALSDEK
jgi:hypothetical protein